MSELKIVGRIKVDFEKDESHILHSVCRYCGTVSEGASDNWRYGRTVVWACCPNCRGYIAAEAGPAPDHLRTES